MTIRMTPLLALAASLIGQTPPAVVSPATPAMPNFSPGPAYADRERMHQGMPSLERAKNGRLWTAWYGGGVGEDDQNYVMLSTSGDDGRTWTGLKLVIDPDGLGPVRAFDPALWHDPQGRMWLFWGQMVRKAGQKDGIEMHNFAMHTGDSGKSDPVWSKPRRISVGVMLNKPTVLGNGTWLMPTCVWRDEKSSRVLQSTDHGETFTTIGTATIPVYEDRNGDENMIVERRDGSLWMLVRTRYGIGESSSTDRGGTWSIVKPSAIPHAESRFFIRRLRSGRLLLVRHDAPRIAQRSHLTAFLSGDDGRSWSKGLLIDERMGVSYPDGVEGPAGRIHLVYDYGRRTDKQILMSVFHERDVANGRFGKDARLRVVVNQASGKNPTVSGSAAKN